MNHTIAEVAVVGGGPAGLTAAIALAGTGLETAVVAMPPVAHDNRTTALLASSVTALETLGVWERCAEHAAPLRRMRIVDDTARLLRAPEVCFDASEIGLPAFAYNIENRHLLAALESRARDIPALTLIAAKADAVTIGDTDVSVSLGNGGRVTARLAIGADGRRSLCRAAAGIDTESRSYPQTALTFNLAHARPHGDTSTEFHTESGPFTLVPLPGLRSSLVCVVEPRRRPSPDGAGRRRARHRDRAALSFASRQGGNGGRTWRVSARGRDRALLRPQSHRPHRRGGACDAADRRARIEPRPARRRHHRRTGHRRAARRRRRRLGRADRALRASRVAPT